MRTLKERHALLKSYGYSQGDSQSRTHCSECGESKILVARAQWWQCCSTMYDEWECYCRKCAMATIENYESPEFAAWCEEQAAEARQVEICRTCGKALEDFSDLGCEVCDTRHAGFTGIVQ